MYIKLEEFIQKLLQKDVVYIYQEDEDNPYVSTDYEVLDINRLKSVINLESSEYTNLSSSKLTNLNFKCQSVNNNYLMIDMYNKHFDDSIDTYLYIQIDSVTYNGLVFLDKTNLDDFISQSQHKQNNL